VHKSILAKKSEHFETVFNLPQAENSVEGLSDDVPIVLEGIHHQDFDHFLTFVYERCVIIYCPGRLAVLTCIHVLNSDEVKTPSFEFLVSVLRLSLMWMVSSGYRYAVKELTRHPDFTPSRQMQLAQQHRIDEWLEPAFRELVKKHAFTLDDVEQMGLFAYWVLTNTQRDIRNHVRSIAYYTPDVVHGFDCSTPLLCKAAWENAWWSGFAKLALHPDNDCRSGDAMHKLSAARIPGMNPECLRSTVDDIWNNNPFDDIDVFVKEGYGHLLERFTGITQPNQWLLQQEARVEANRVTW
jgi:hypothetical protein